MSTPSVSRPIVLCADDYAINPAVSHGILELLAAGRLSATSCMTESPLWPRFAEMLRPYVGQADIGLHFNLTEPFSGFEHARLSRFMLGALTRRLERDRIRARLEGQLARFEAALGIPPDFIDGHQHVHMFPVIRDVVLEVCRARHPHPWLRAVHPHHRPGGYGFKRAVLDRIGGVAWSDRLRRLGHPHNVAFAGIYDFSPQADYAALMRGWLTISAGGLIMCHPARDLADGDPIATARQREFTYLSGAQFGADLASAGATLARLTACAEIAKKQEAPYH